MTRTKSEQKNLYAVMHPIYQKKIIEDVYRNIQRIVGPNCIQTTRQHILGGLSTYRVIEQVCFNVAQYTFYDTNRGGSGLSGGAGSGREFGREFGRIEQVGGGRIMELQHWCLYILSPFFIVKSTIDTSVLV